MKLWPEESVLEWIPREQRAKGLPKSPYDWSNEFLYQLLQLAELTEDDFAKAVYFLERAPR